MLMSSLAVSLGSDSNAERKAEPNLLSGWNDCLSGFDHLSVFYGNWLGERWSKICLDWERGGGDQDCEQTICWGWQVNAWALCAFITKINYTGIITFCGIATSTQFYNK